MEGARRYCAYRLTPNASFVQGTGGIEPPYEGFADLRLTTWLRALYKAGWSGRRESNPRHSAWEADVLPLNYSRFSLPLVFYQNRLIVSRRPKPEYRLQVDSLLTRRGRPTQSADLVWPETGLLGIVSGFSMGSTWAGLGLNQRPLRCERSALPLSYPPLRDRRQALGVRPQKAQPGTCWRLMPDA
jgi:hypothetical protein